MGLGVYDLIPDFQDCCPLCEGAGCAARHGLYLRGAADLGGAVYEQFPVPRFLCRRKGPQEPQARTFSVLPTALAPRRRFSLPLMLWLLSLVLERGRTVRQALDRLAESCRGQPGGPLCPDEAAVHRLIALLSRGFERLQSFPVPGWAPGAPVQGRRPQALALLRLLSRPCRGSPFGLVPAFQRHHFPNLLLDLRTG
jgi:hypothetical protein